MSWIRLQSANSLPVMHFLVHACTTTPPCVESLPRATIIFIPHFALFVHQDPLHYAIVI